MTVVGTIEQALGDRMSHTIFLKVRVVDESGNRADWSNIASASVVSRSFANSSVSRCSNYPVVLY